jgi:hypothetical protein
MALKVTEVELSDGTRVQVTQGTWTPAYAALVEALEPGSGVGEAGFVRVVMDVVGECLRHRYSEQEVHGILARVAPDDGAVMGRLVAAVRGR